MPAKSKYQSKSGRTDGETAEQSTIDAYMSPQSTSQDGDGDRDREKTSSVEWVRAPEDQRANVGFGEFPFKMGESDSEGTVVQDMTFHGRVMYVKLAPKQEFSHTLDLQVDEKYIDNLKQFVHTNKNVSAD